MPLEIKQIKMFETPKPTQMKKQTDRNNLAFGHHQRPLGWLAQQEGPGGFVKIFTEFIHKTKNIANFSVSGHWVMYLNI